MTPGGKDGREPLREPLRPRCHRLHRSDFDQHTFCLQYRGGKRCAVRLAGTAARPFGLAKAIGRNTLPK